MAKSVAVPFLRLPDIWKEAEAVRAKCWDSTIPVNIDVISERCFDLLFVPIPSLSSMVNLDAYVTGNLREIHYDPASIDVRVRFSVAHELGHVVMHPGQITTLRSGSYAEWKETIDNLPDLEWGRAEFQAREFAGRLLVPKEALITEIGKEKAKLDGAKKIPDIEHDALALAVARTICGRFNVSGKVIQMRIKSEGIDLFNV